MKLHALGINHETAPVALRERIAFPAHALPTALASLRGVPQVREVALLSTCNRTELYAVTGDDGSALAAWLAAGGTGGSLTLDDYLYHYQDGEAARHLFRVATGLDSLVLGEPQILGQVKQAWAAARTAGTLGNRLDRLFQQAFVTAKRARSQTRIGNNPVSVASVAVRLAQESFAALADSTVLLVGAGETVELTAQHLAQAGTRRLLVANRTLAHAQALASRHGGVALPLTELDRHLAEVDIVFSATASRTPVLTRELVEQALLARRHRPMLLMDLAVPRDIDPDVAALRDAYLYSVDDLERAVEENRSSRREAANAAEAIVQMQVENYLQATAAAPFQQPLRMLRDHGHAARVEVLERARQQLEAGRDPGQVLEFLAHTLTNRLLHAPTIAIRDVAASGSPELAMALERALAPAAKDRNDAADTAP